MSNIEHFQACGKLHYEGVKAKELTLKQILAVPCPTCGVGIGKSCVPHSGAPRSRPHVDRKFAAIDAIDPLQTICRNGTVGPR